MLSHDSTTRITNDTLFTDYIVSKEILIAAPQYRCGNKTIVTIIGCLGVSNEIEARIIKVAKISPCSGGSIIIDGFLTVTHNAKICNLSALDVYPCLGNVIYFHSKIAVTPSIPPLNINPFSTIKADDRLNTPNITLVLQPKGTGALVTTEPDGGITGGNNRGENAVDLQMVRDDPTQVASGDLSTIGGGSGNTASNIHSTVAGGNGNTSSGSDSTVGGGTGNTSSGDVSTVSGGQGNKATKTFSTIGGGVGNEANGDSSTIAGGQGNKTSNSFATVGGGNQNIAGGGVSTVSGGQNNTAAGNFTTIPGGFNVNALHNNSYVYGSGPDPTNSSNIYQVVYNLKPSSYTPPNLSETFFINGNLLVNGDVGGTTKSFIIPHPVLPNKTLKHLCLEAPRPDLIYRGQVKLINGKAGVDIDTSSKMTDTTFSKLAKNIQVHLTNRDNWDLVKVQNYDTLQSGKFTIISNNEQSNATIDWLIIAERVMDEIQIEF